jgi:hypothetical protein
VQVLAHPFRLKANGTAETVEQDSDAANTQLLAVLILTRLDERPLQPGFGITDPTFIGVDLSEIAAAATAYGPDISLDDATVDYRDGGVQLVKLTFS